MPLCRVIPPWFDLLENTHSMLVCQSTVYQYISHMNTYPFALSEAPLKSLESAGYVTPNHLHFVRNHGPVPQLTWEEHRIEITGLVNSPTTISMDDIASMPAITLPVTMVCAGNRRKEQNMVKQSIGFGWYILLI